MSGWQFGDGNPFHGAPCTSDEAQQWMADHRGASQWDYTVMGESNAAHVQRLYAAQRLCKGCGARKQCLDIRSRTVAQYGFPVSGVWGGRIFKDGQAERPDPTELALMPREDMAA